MQGADGPVRQVDQQSAQVLCEHARQAERKKPSEQTRLEARFFVLAGCKGSSRTAHEQLTGCMCTVSCIQ